MSWYALFDIVEKNLKKKKQFPGSVNYHLLNWIVLIFWDENGRLIHHFLCWSEGKEGTEGTESIGEASGTGERSHCEEANSRYAKAHANISQSAGTGPC